MGKYSFGMSMHSHMLYAQRKWLKMVRNLALFFWRSQPGEALACHRKVMEELRDQGYLPPEDTHATSTQTAPLPNPTAEESISHRKAP
jgi:hypothetical protein